jgi:hypothetical protein
MRGLLIPVVSHTSPDIYFTTPPLNHPSFYRTTGPAQAPPFSKKHEPGMTSSSSSSAAGDETLPHGHSNVEQIQTKNNMGFDMGKSSYRADTWWKAYDPAHPEARTEEGREGGEGKEGSYFFHTLLFYSLGV